NRQYSMRAFAKQLEVSPAYLSRLLKGDRHVSKPMAERIITKLNLDPIDAAELRAQNTDRTATYGKLNYDLFRDDQIRVLSDWTHYAIIALLELEDFKADPKWIAK